MWYIVKRFNACISEVPEGEEKGTRKKAIGVEIKLRISQD